MQNITQKTNIYKIHTITYTYNIYIHMYTMHTITYTYNIYIHIHDTYNHIHL